MSLFLFYLSASSSSNGYYVYWYLWELYICSELDGEICENCSYAIYIEKDIMCFGVAREE